MKRFFLIFSILLGANNVWAQQDPLYKLYQFNQMMVNPAYAGVYNRFYSSFNSSVQWIGIEGAPVTNTVTVQSAIKDAQMGLGAVVVNDRIGINNNTEVQLAASYNIILGEAKLAMGLQGGVTNYAYDLDKLTLDHYDDPELNEGLTNTIQPNFGIGLMLVDANYFVGASVPRILNVTEEDDGAIETRYRRHYYLTGGYHFGSKYSNQYKIVAMMRLVENQKPSIDLTASTNIDGLVWFGVSVRDFGHYGIFTFFDIANSFRFGYAFELPANSLIKNNYGTHQISLAFDMNFGGNNILESRNF